MRIIERNSYGEKKFVCNYCRSIIGYFPEELIAEWNQYDYNSSEGYYKYKLNCPVCNTINYIANPTK